MQSALRDRGAHRLLDPPLSNLIDLVYRKETPSNGAPGDDIVTPDLVLAALR